MSEENADSGIPAAPQRPPGVCISWEEKARELPPISGEAQLVRKVWEDVDGLAYMYIWQLLVSF